MSTALENAHHQLVREVADSYSRQGYYVQSEPALDDLPEALQSLHPPDLIIMTSQGDHIFVEVKQRGRERDPAYWQKLQSTIAALPDWTFEFVVDNRREQELVDSNQPLLSSAEIEARLQAGQQIASEGFADSGLLITWAALEAVLHRMSEQEQIYLPNLSPATLMTRLVSEGSLDREDYAVLMRVLQTRNQAAHGRRPEHFDSSLVETTSSIARRLLEQQPNSQEAA